MHKSRCELMTVSPTSSLHTGQGTNISISSGAGLVVWTDELTGFTSFCPGSLFACLLVPGFLQRSWRGDGTEIVHWLLSWTAIKYKQPCINNLRWQDNTYWWCLLARKSLIRVLRLRRKMVAVVEMEISNCSYSLQLPIAISCRPKHAVPLPWRTVLKLY